MSGGSLVGNAVVFVASIVLARIYAPSEHGELAIISAYAVVMTPLVSGRFEAAIPIPGRETDAFRLLRLGLGWATILALLLTGLVLVVSWYGRGPEIVRDLPALIWAAPVFALLSACLSLVTQFSVRNERYQLVAARNLSYPSATAGAQVGLGLASWGGGGLVLGTIIGRLSTLLLFGHQVFRWRRSYAADADSPSYRQLLRRFSRFPTVLAVSSMINGLGLQMPVLLLGLWYGTEAAGFFGMSQRTLGVPIVLVGAAIGQVYLAELSRAMRNNDGEASQIFRRSSRALLAAGVLIAVVLLTLGPTLFAFVFGEQWRVSGQIAQAMSVSFAIQLVASPLSQALIVYERYWAQLGWDVGRLALVTVALFVGHRSGLDLVSACWALSFATASSYVVSWMLSKRTIQQSETS